MYFCMLDVFAWNRLNAARCDDVNRARGAV